jgi:peptidoglycan/LPS O-acetylase OafA/YrhL
VFQQAAKGKKVAMMAKNKVRYLAEAQAGMTIPAIGSTASVAGRIDGLDGLRAIAIVAVLLFHGDLYWARGGYLGVDLFFVLSGFLITGLLANEIQSSGRLHLSRFYWRRAKRLLPAAWLMMVCVTVAAAWIAVDALPRLRGDAVASLFYMTNWELLSVHTSYFEATGRQPLLQHLWSLAIEEQFYIAWAILVPLGLHYFGRRGLAALAVLLAMTSAAWMWVLAAKMGYPDHGDPSRLYFGTDTHGFSLGSPNAQHG